MQKVCWIMKIKPGKNEDYIKIHKKGKVWPGVLNAMKEAGFEKMRIFIYKLLVIVYAEVENLENASLYLSKNPHTIKWNKISLSMMDEPPDYASAGGINKLPLVFDFEDGKQLN